FQRAPGTINEIILTGGAAPKRNDALFRGEFNFEQLGIGGLDDQFARMFRTAFASRIFPGVVKELGTNHVRGILLFGPPGCGKTLIARQIGKILNAREPKIVNGPEVLDKFVGGSEEKIRALFADAEKEQKEMGDASMLHIIIFDEMDAIMKTRGSTRDNTGVSDSIVNQLLSKIDGVDSLNNILIIGMTNRKDMIDEAILRPGRLEIHIEIPLPNEHGRLQIINIKTAEMRRHNRITAECIERLPELAERAKNFTGAELEGLVRNAASFALARNVNPASLKTLDDKAIKVEWADFERALLESSPAYGNKDNTEISTHFSNGICNYGNAFESLWTSLNRLLNQVRQSARTPLLSVLLEGAVSSGKTAIAAKLAADSNFPFVRMISPDSMIGLGESERCGKLLKVFSDAYRSPLSIIFIDDIERLIEYTPVGHRFSNPVLQTLLILLRKVPVAPNRLMVVATTAISHLLDDLQLTQAFSVTLHVTQLQTPQEYAKVLKEYSGMSTQEIASIAKAIHKPIGVKQLLLVLEMATAEFGTHISADQFMQCLQTVGF
ncbi:ATP-binding protein, partial [archaeon]